MNEEDQTYEIDLKWPTADEEEMKKGENLVVVPHDRVVAVRGVRAWSSRMSFFHVSIVSLKLQECHSYHSLISARKSLE